jgi:2-C-methyl-D-erythritol 4-phosphate cytidylyltransferase
MAVALLVAGGRGERLGSDAPKALIELAGRPMVDWSLEALAASEEVERIVVALPGGVDVASTADSFAGTPVTVVSGGTERSHSVRNALAAAGAADVVLVHDAARPLVTTELIDICLAALTREGDWDAAIAAAPVTDTVKRAPGGIAVEATLERSELWAVQTPQVFARAALENALSRAEDEIAAATDDAVLVERGGGRVRVVPASAENIKVTTEVDLRLAELLLAARGHAA